jgi:hypothetical protein
MSEIPQPSGEESVTPVKVRLKTFRSSEVIRNVAESCRGCRTLGNILVREQARVDDVNRNEEQTHEWAFDNVEGAVVFCEGKSLFTCNAEVVQGRIFDGSEAQHPAGFVPHDYSEREGHTGELVAAARNMPLEIETS